jgi:hypothetical protein
MIDSKNFRDITTALEAKGIEVVEAERHQGMSSHAKMIVRHGGYTARFGAGINNISGHRLGNIVREAKHALMKAGATFPKGGTMTKTRKKQKPVVRLKHAVRAEVYALLMSRASTAEELAQAYDVSAGTIDNIRKEGKRGDFNNYLLPHYNILPTGYLEKKLEPASTAPTLPDGIELTAGPLTTPEPLHAMSRAQGIQSQLEELRTEAAKLGVTVHYSLALSWNGGTATLSNTKET